MPDSVPASRHLLRWIVLAIIAVLVALAIALAVHVHNLLQPQRFTTLLENDLAAAGIRLNMQAPAEPALFPHPGVQLQGFSLTNIGSQTPVLQADGATIVVPWRALLHGEVAIERVDVEAPHIDLGELEALLARLPHRAGPPRLPTITTGVHMSQGTLTRDGSPLLFDFSLATGALAPGLPFHLNASARGASGRRLAAALTTVPSTAQDGVIDFNALHVSIAEQQGATLQLGGKGIWRGGGDLTLHLQGTLRHSPLTPAPPGSANPKAKTGATTPAGATPAPAASRSVTDKIALDVTPARGGAPMMVALKLDGDDAHADLQLQPTAFDDWWARLLAAKPGQPSGPLPFTGTVRAKQIDLGWLKATGLSINAGPDLAPASAATAAPAAAVSSVPASH